MSVYYSGLVPFWDMNSFMLIRTRISLYEIKNRPVFSPVQMDVHVFEIGNVWLYCNDTKMNQSENLHAAVASVFVYKCMFLCSC